MTSAYPLAIASVVDTMVLAMFVDADQVGLLSALAEERLFVPPSIIDHVEVPPFVHQPVAEFARGIFSFQQRLGHPLAATRFVRRTAFFGAMGTSWEPITLSVAELTRAHHLASPRAWGNSPARRPRRIGRGEAECAAVAVSRGWRLWSDDAAIIDLLAILHPGHPVERTSDLLTRAVRERRVSCAMASDLYNQVFKGELGLWSRVSARCVDDTLVFA